MSTVVRRLTANGIEEFRKYLDHLRGGGTDPVPHALLVDPAASETLTHEIPITPRTLTSNYDLGVYMVEILRPLDRHVISRDTGLWAWLALYFFHYFCPAEKDGKRNPLEDAVYLLSPTFQHNRYYRHAIRTPWLAVLEHGENSKVMLVTSAKGTRSDIFEQLASRQQLFGNKTVIACASELYLDKTTGRLRRGAAGKGAGSVRRLAAVAQQLDLTYDLVACNVEVYLRLLPKEFSKFLIPAA